MKHPKFNWKTYPADYNELSTGAKMNVGELNEFRRAKDNELIRMLCFNSGIRQTKELQNWNAWNGCVYIDVDYKNYLSVNENAEDPVKVFANVWTYLANNYSDHFYYGEYSRSKKGFHFIFYTETEYPTEERREHLLLKANAAVIANYATLKILSGIITTDAATNGALNNEVKNNNKGDITLDSVRVIVT